MTTGLLDSGLPEEPSTTKSSSSFLDRVDTWCEKVGDRFNPILVKETRQALKSRQFIVTFFALLFAALAWTVVGSLMQMPQIYVSPSAPRMLIGYYVVLAVPLLLVVPLAAYRSLEGEIDDGTLELLSISALSPWQIVLGKLASATLQMMLYFVTLFPCMAYAYTLRGVDLPTTLLIVGILMAGALLLTVVALFFAPIARSRTGRIGTLLAVMGILIIGVYGISAMVIGMILLGNPLDAEMIAYCVVSTILIGTCLGHLLLTCTAAQLTPESENRSTPIRLSLLMLVAVVAGVSVYAISLSDEQIGLITFLFMVGILGAIWTLCGSMMVGESSVMTPRIRRELPSSFLGRLFLTWITPGPSTGLVFAAAGAIAIGILGVAGTEYALRVDPTMMGRGGARLQNMLIQVALMYVSYLVAFWICVRLIIRVVRIRNNPRAEIGFAAFVVVAILAALVPYSIGLHWNDYRSYSYSEWQLTNWIWTFGRILEGRFQTDTAYSVAGFVAGLFILCLLLMPQIVVPRKIATPKRVEEELAKES